MLSDLQVAMNRTGYLMILSILFCYLLLSSSQDVTSSFHCSKLGHPGGVFVVEFSDGETLLASGQKSDDPMVPIEIKKKHGSAVYSMAFAPDNRRFSMTDKTEKSSFTTFQREFILFECYTNTNSSYIIVIPFYPLTITGRNC